MISGMCADGKHGRCTGWLVIPNYGDGHGDTEISVRCWCAVCEHPDVDPYRHLTQPPTRPAWKSNS
jgi:hypothetical protein